MPAGLIDSQFATLEAPSADEIDVQVLDEKRSLAELIEAAVNHGPARQVSHRCRGGGAMVHDPTVLRTIVEVGAPPTST